MGRRCVGFWEGDVAKNTLAWKRSHDDGYRIYEIAIDPNTGARVGELKQVTLQGAQGKRAAELAEVHKKIKLSREELLKITNWVDTNGQFYGMYWGRKHIQHKAHPNFRPTPTFEWAASRVSPLPEDKR